MIYQITANTAPEALYELLTTMPGVAREGQSRNGKVYSVPGLSILTIKDPTARVVFDPLRDANPFFHVMEFVWMMAGSNNGQWPAKFVPSYMDYAEDDGYVHGAYGWRWRNHFEVDQILTAIKLLKKDPKDRQIVIQMWDVEVDLAANVRDRPCNTHIYLRADNGVLDMTVCNRSNDAVWGMLGANVVHMTMLQEFISVATRIPLGVYQVVSNNLHIYPDMVKNFDKLWNRPTKNDYYNPDHWDEAYVVPEPILLSGEEPSGFLRDCQRFMEYPSGEYNYYFLNRTAKPMYKAWDAGSTARCDDIASPDWRIACNEWLTRSRRGV